MPSTKPTKASLKWYNPAQTAEILRVNIDTVYKMIKQRRLKAVKVNRHYLIRHEWLDRLLEFGDPKFQEPAEQSDGKTTEPVRK
ncbi:helix-turn-helix domain-containing protein [Victivallis vadensis]|uniref:helix-turn-helix domain-containing protein n=1 Tax=Victivallis vadensis TaxID=172901 RepID=UPI0025960832|nr:helix-turn-helix domain-containing protein [uncultured Victivallis sp.]